MRAPIRFLFAPLALLLAACGASERVPDGEAGACAACHLREYRGARAHVGEKPPTCGVCHAQTGWQKTAVHHRWALTGAHAKASCLACHGGARPKYDGLSEACVDCHRKDYEGAKGHANKPTTCDECHSTKAWSPTLPRNAAPKSTTTSAPPSHATSAPRTSPTTKATPTPAPATGKPTAPTTKPTYTPKPAPKPTPTKAKPDVVTGASG